MSPESLPKKKKLPWLKLAVLAVVLLGGAALLLRGAHPRELVDQGMALIRAAGPGVFFAAMLILPALGAPMLGFTIPAGEAFAPQLTLGGVIAVALVVIALNLALTYWLARYALRPLLTKLVTRYGYNVPRVTPANALVVTLLVRLTPGPPLFVQGYLLGLAEVPFKLYMIVSWLCVLPWSVGAIIMGRGILNGNFKVAATGSGVLVVAAVVVQLVRKKYATRAD
ncbi:MAG: VTT domain-containing protein [Undibacterium sp.]|nr:VTT domain-containing protein [Opitutaceae bacterium]